MSDSEPNSTVFYVGYRPVPSSLARFLRWTIPATVLLLLALSVAFSRSQPDPGSAIWHDAKARDFQGTLIVDPYPMLLVSSNSEKPDSEPVVYLLVEMGKRGGRANLVSNSGKSVSLSGWLLEREGRRMIELEPGENTVRPTNEPSSLRIERRHLGRLTLQGEIVDSKCYLGAMKPGDGKTHKACATLCIRGGMPPMLVTQRPAGAREFYLLIDPSGSPLSPACWPLISEPVQVTADAESLGDLKILRLSPDQVRPL